MMEHRTSPINCYRVVDESPCSSAKGEKLLFQDDHDALRPSSNLRSRISSTLSLESALTMSSSEECDVEQSDHRRGALLRRTAQLDHPLTVMDSSERPFKADDDRAHTPQTTKSKPNTNLSTDELGGETSHSTFSTRSPLPLDVYLAGLTQESSRRPIIVFDNACIDAISARDTNFEFTMSAASSVSTSTSTTTTASTTKKKRRASSCQTRNRPPSRWDSAGASSASTHHTKTSYSRRHSSRSRRTTAINDDDDDHGDHGDHGDEGDVEKSSKSHPRWSTGDSSNDRRLCVPSRSLDSSPIFKGQTDTAAVGNGKRSARSTTTSSPTKASWHTLKKMEVTESSAKFQIRMQNFNRMCQRHIGEPTITRHGTRRNLRRNTCMSIGKLSIP